MNKIGVGVGAIITNSQNEILLLKRKNNVPNKLWSIPGGLIEYDESPLISIKREMIEETGLEIIRYKFLGYVVLKFENQHWLSFVFHILSYSGQIKISDNEPFENADWFSLNSTPELDYIAKTTIDIYKLPKWLPQ